MIKRWFVCGTSPAPTTTTQVVPPTTTTEVIPPTTTTEVIPPTTGTTAVDETPTPVRTTTAQLAKTGGSLTGILWAGLALLLGGVAVLLFTYDLRSRRERPTLA